MGGSKFPPGDDYSTDFLPAGLLQERDKMAGKKVGLILSGGNADKDLFARVLG